MHPMGTRSVMDIPELVFCIVPHLDNRSLSRCAQASRAWASRFVPLLWHSIKLSHHRTTDKYDKHRRYDCQRGRKSATDAFIKHGHFIRELVVESPLGVQLLAHHCSNLASLVCCFDAADEAYFNKHKSKTMAAIWDLVARNPHLHTFRLGVLKDGHFREISSPFYPLCYADISQHLVHLQNLSKLQHLSVPMADTDYYEFCTRFPRLVEAHFVLRTFTSIRFPYQLGPDTSVHHAYNQYNQLQMGKSAPRDMQKSLRQLGLSISFMMYASEFEAVLERFPQLERLMVYNHHRQSSMFLELRADPATWFSFRDLGHKKPKSAHCGPMLRVLDREPFLSDYEISKIVARLPVPLRSVQYQYLGSYTMEALATHCRETLEYVWGGFSRSFHEEYTVDPQYMSKSVGMLLAQCPKLKSVNSPFARVHIKYIMSHPWVCCDSLEFLRCKVVGIPKLTEAEKEMCKDVTKRRQEWQENPPQGMKKVFVSRDERQALAKYHLIQRCHQALRDQVAKCPKLKYDFRLRKE